MAAQERDCDKVLVRLSLISGLRNSIVLLLVALLPWLVLLLGLALNIRSLVLIVDVDGKIVAESAARQSLIEIGTVCSEEDVVAEWQLQLVVVRDGKLEDEYEAQGLEQDGWSIECPTSWLSAGVSALGILAKFVIIETNVASPV